MRSLIERVLSRLFPVKNYVIRTPEEAKSWFRYEAGNHPEIDPFRSLGLRDSWAGRIKQYDIPGPKTPKESRERNAKPNFSFGDSIISYFSRSQTATVGAGPEASKSDS